MVISHISSVVAQDESSNHEVIVLTVEGPVTPAMGTYLERGLSEAEASNAALLILRLDTPGGSVEVMGQLVRQLSNANVPTLVHVWPSGGRAASAGTFVTLSADLAAMAPQTTIGAASVVGSGGEEIGETLSKKITNDLVASIRSQTERRGEEAADWAERAITEAIVANAEEALEIGLIDFIARDLSEVLEQADNSTVELASGEEITLDLSHAITKEMEMTVLEAFLHVITDPNIALMLLSLGGLALFYEISSPGGYVGGIFGIIALMLGFYSLGSLDANWAGLGLILFAFILFLIETQTPTNGLFTAGGLAAFIFGTILLFQTSYRPVSLELLALVSLFVAGFMVFAVGAVLRTRHRSPVTGQEGLIGTIGEVRSALGAEQRGMVFINGELWRAFSSTSTFLPKGSQVRVVALRRLDLDVEATDQELLQKGL
jgi:membrane-bound serine protease (ClpP class)